MHTVAFACFALLWGSFIVFGNLSRLTSDEDAARFWTFLYLAPVTLAYVPLTYFGALYPVRHGMFAKNPVAAALLLLPAAAGAAALLLAPSTLHAGFDRTPSGLADRWGPLFPLFSVLFYAAFYYVVFTLYRHQRASAKAIEVRRTAYVLAALLVYVAYDTVENFIFFAWPLARGDLVLPAAWQSVVFAVLAATGLALLAAVAFGMLREVRRGAFDARLVLASLTIPALFGLLSGLSKTSPEALPVPLDTVGLWRTLSVALIAYAILRFELFDIDVKVKRGAIAAGIILVSVAAAIGLQQVLERALGSTGLAITLTQIALIGGVAAILTRAPAASAWLAARVLPGTDAPQKLDARRLEVYEAALAQAHATGGGIDAQSDFLADLRQRLGISDAEHQLLARLVASPARAAGAIAAGGGAPAITPGALVAGRYRVERLLGEGAYGRAFLAQDETLGRRLVLKAIHAHRARSEEATRNFLREARLAASLDHPNVIRVYDFGYHGDAPYITMEYADGGSLADAMSQRARLPAHECARVMRDVLSGLAHVHARGVLHRDLKPSNVFLTRDGRAKIADFGLARGEEFQATRSGLDALGGFDAGAGTPAYMSPEAARGLPPTPQGDVYSAGAMLHHMLCGETYIPFEGRGAFEIRRAIAEDPPRADALPDAFRPVVLRALEKDPARRFASAQEMLDALPGAIVPAGLAQRP